MTRTLAWSTHSTALGGAELAILELGGALLGAGIVDRIHLLAPSSEGPLIDAARLVDGFVLHKVPFASWMTLEPRSALASWRRHGKNMAVTAWIGRLLHRLCPDVAISNGITVPTLAWAAGRARVPHTWFVHEFGTYHHFHVGEARTWRAVARHGRLLLASSKPLTQHVANRTGRPTKVIPPLAQVRAACPQRPLGKPLRLLCVGSLRPDKGIPDLLAARELLASEGIEATVTVVGATPRERQVVRDPQVRLLGAVPDLAPQFEAADVVVVPSHLESFGRVAVEAVMSARPVVAAGNAGARATLHAGLVRWFDPGDRSGIARAVRETLAVEPDERAELLSRGRAWASREFSPDAAVKRLAPVLEAIIRTDAAGG